jgi:hypothetical protein
MYDFDNDGHKDLFYATSHFPRLMPWTGADSALPNCLLRNAGNGWFDNVSKSAGADFQLGALHHGAAFADFDNDGRIDVAVSALNSPAKLFRNASPGPAHWLALRLLSTSGNREGLGAKIRLTLPNGRMLYNHATTSVGYACSSEPLVHFGLGPYETAQEIEITWPGGRVQKLANLKGDRTLTVREQ